MLTEDEAKTQWCPFANTRLVKASDPASDRCIGSACMAFRWVPDVVLEMSGHRVGVDAVDADMLNGCWWDGRYAKHDDGYLHRRIVGRIYGDIPPEMFVDHIDGDPTNNRRGNLRIASKIENAANASSRGGASRYRGVSAARNGRWQAQISREGVRMHLGTFDTEEQAAAAYDEAAKRIHGEFARPNLTPPQNIGRVGYCGLAGRPE